MMAHELLHFWNGLSMSPLDEPEEWFKEGATDYLTIMTLARNGLIDETLLFKRLDSFVEEMFISREPDADATQRKRFAAVFGPADPR